MRFSVAKPLINNIYSNFRYDLSYIVEKAGWSIREDGKYITNQLNTNNLLRARISEHQYGIFGQIIHYGSDHAKITKNESHTLLHGKRQILTIFHVVENSDAINRIRKIINDVDLVHTSCNITLNRLLDLGVHRSKIVKIPLGVDIDLFRPFSQKERYAIRKTIGIPSSSFVVGSFQKDGVGWGNGDEPKLIKGPDVLIGVLKKIASQYPIYVLLVGPARGYVAKHLKEAKIPFQDIGYLKNYRDIAKYYQALDLYLITSRIEGGPKAILESWASGVPIVSTTVGMVPDIATDGANAFLVPSEDVESIYQNACKLIDNKSLRETFIRNGSLEVKKYSWSIIAHRYYNELYKNML